jgi:hypothetical protein
MAVNNIISSVWSPSGAMTPQSGQELIERTFIQQLFQPSRRKEQLGISTYTGVKTKIELSGLVAPKNFLRPKAAGCEPDYLALNKAITDKSITPENIRLRLEQCADEFQGTMYEMGLNPGTDFADMRGTVVGQMIEQIILPAMESNITRLMFLGDKSATNDEATAIDGYMKLWEADSTVTKVNLGSLASAGSAITGIEALYNAIDISAVSRGFGDMRIGMTFSYLRALQRDLAQTNVSSAAFTRILQDNTESLSYMGIPIVAIPDLDAALTDWYTVSGAVVNPDRAFLTTVGNLITATDLEADQGTVKVDFNNVKETTMFKSDFKLGLGYKDGKALVYQR